MTRKDAIAKRTVLPSPTYDHYFDVEERGGAIYIVPSRAAKAADALPPDNWERVG